MWLMAFRFRLCVAFTRDAIIVYFLLCRDTSQKSPCQFFTLKTQLAAFSLTNAYLPILYLIFLQKILSRFFTVQMVDVKCLCFRMNFSSCLRKMTAGKECQTKCHALCRCKQLMETNHQCVKKGHRFDEPRTWTNHSDKRNSLDEQHMRVFDKSSLRQHFVHSFLPDI